MDPSSLNFSATDSCPKPLYWPDGYKPSYEDVRSDPIWRYLPPFNGISRHRNWLRHIRPIVEQLDAQIALRPPTLEHWKQTGIHPEFLKLLFKEIIVEIGWQNDHFIPNDSLDIVLFPHSYSDGGELIAIIYQSERKLGVRIRDAFKPEDLRKQNFGEFVGRCWAEVETFCVGPWVGRQEVLEMDRSRN